MEEPVFCGVFFLVAWDDREGREGGKTPDLLGPLTGLSQEHNQCLVTDIAAAGTSPLLPARPPARDVRDELQPSPERGARPTRLRQPRGGLPAPARARRPPYSLRRAGPVNRGAVRGRVQLDGRRLLLGHFEPGKGASNSAGKAAPRLPPSAKSRARRAGPAGGRGPGAASGRRRAPRGPVGASGRWRARGTPALLARGWAPRAGNPRVSQQAQLGSPRRPPSPSVNRWLGLEAPGSAARETEPRSRHRPGKCRCLLAALPVAPRSGPREALQGGGGAGEGDASLPPPGAAFSTRPLGSARLPRRQPMRAGLRGR